jgi:hypothetical protein
MVAEEGALWGLSRYTRCLSPLRHLEQMLKNLAKNLVAVKDLTTDYKFTIIKKLRDERYSGDIRNN